MDRKICLPLLVACIVGFPISAIAACDEPYGMCVSQCATSNTPERCIQRCQHSMTRCSKSGVFQMPIGFKVYASPESEARAQARHPVGESAKRGSR